MSQIIAIDPGTEKSAWIFMVDGEPTAYAIESNEELRARLGDSDGISNYMPVDMLAIEYMHSMGMPQSQDVLDTQFWAGRFVEAWGGDWRPIKRRDVKLHICGNPRAKDANIRQALLDRFPKTGGGKTPQVGTKSKPGPLYGVTSHVWSALAIAITCAETTQG